MRVFGLEWFGGGVTGPMGLQGFSFRGLGKQLAAGRLESYTCNFHDGKTDFKTDF